MQSLGRQSMKTHMVPTVHRDCFFFIQHLWTLLLMAAVKSVSFRCKVAPPHSNHRLNSLHCPNIKLRQLATGKQCTIHSCANYSLKSYFSNTWNPTKRFFASESNTNTNNERRVKIYTKTGDKGTSRYLAFQVSFLLVKISILIHNRYN